MNGLEEDFIRTTCSETALMESTHRIQLGKSIVNINVSVSIIL